MGFCNLVCLQQSKSLGINLVFDCIMLEAVRILRIPSIELLESIIGQALFSF